MMSVFQQTKLKNVANIFSGYAFKSQDFRDNGVPAIKITNIKNGYIDLTETGTQYLYEYFLTKVDKKFIVKCGDVLISLTGSHLTQPNSVVGRVALYKNTSVSLLNQRAGKLVIQDKEKCDQRFLFYLLSTSTLRKEIALLAFGAANQANVSPKDIEKIKIFLPPLPIQKKIAAILSAYDNLIENNNRRIAILEKMAEEIYREWFVRMRFPGHEKVKFHKRLPEGWEIVKLGRIINLTMGQSPQSQFYNTTGDGLPFNQGVGTYGDRFPKKENYCSVRGRIALKGDILFSVRAPVGRLNIADCKMIIGRGLAAINHKKGYNSYLFYLLKNNFSDEDIHGNGSIFNSVGKDELNKFPVINPTEYLIDKYNKISSMLDLEIENLFNANKMLRQSRESLLSRLVSGKLSVEDLDIRFPKSMEDNGA